MSKKSHITKIHKLICEIEHDYILIGIHSVLEDYRLAYFLNKTFNISLKRKDKNIVFTNKEGSFSNYDFEDQVNFSYWSLINNKQVIDVAVEEGNWNIFEEISKTHILIPEKKTTDYFLKIEGSFERSEIEELTNKINAIHRVMTTYRLDPETLKSKDFLIV